MYLIYNVIYSYIFILNFGLFNSIISLIVIIFLGNKEKNVKKGIFVYL